MANPNDQPKIFIQLADVKATAKDGTEHTTRVYLFDLGNAVISKPQGPESENPRLDTKST